MAAMRHCGDTTVGSSSLVLLLEPGHIPLVQVGLVCSLGAGGDEGKSDGGGKKTETTVGIH